MLLAPSEIRAKLAAKYRLELASFPGRFASLVPKPPEEHWAERTAAGIQRCTGVKPPCSFVAALREWDLDQCEIAGIVFSHRASYVSAIEKFNGAPPGVQWWGDRDCDGRPNGEVMIAHGDPHVILLDASSGCIQAFIVEEGSASATTVADDLSLFIRGIGTVASLDLQPSEVDPTIKLLLPQLGTNVAKAFWHELASVHAVA